MRTRHALPRGRALRLDALEDRHVPAPVVLDPNLAVRPVITGLANPTSMALLRADEFLILEKNTGQVKHVVNGQVENTLIDLAVNNASERGLLGIALDPRFRLNRAVYLYWTQPALPGDTTFPSVRQGPDQPDLGADTNDVLAVPLLGNRVDRFLWTGDALVFDKNLIRLRVFQSDGAPTPPNQGDDGQPVRGNHDGGVIRFGLDGKLYVIVGDLGRRSLFQNNLQGPVPDDQFGGPMPDDAHLSGVILRLNSDGSAPATNPFFAFGALVKRIDPEAGVNLQKVFAYGVRNSFGLAVDPITGRLWDSENAEDAFDEVNLVPRGFNSGWIQTMGPVARQAEFKDIEVNQFPTTQQLRWPFSRLADTPAEAQARMVNLPGSRYSDPEFSWRIPVPPTALAFPTATTLGATYAQDLVVGNLAGQLLDFNLNATRTGFRFDSAALRDLVDDNSAKFVSNESTPLAFGTGFGSITDLQRDPTGGLYVVVHAFGGISDGAVYEVFRKGTRFSAGLTGADEVPPRLSTATGKLDLRVIKGGRAIEFALSVEGISNVVGVHLHLNVPGQNGPIVVGLFSGPPGGGPVTGTIASGQFTAAKLTGPLAGRTLRDLIREIQAGRVYVNVHTDDGMAPPDTGPGDFPSGEIRGQVLVLS
jgi:glucose/arabinose dehydrogenase